MRRVNRSAILSNVSRKATQYENSIITAIDNRNRKERRDQAPAISEPNYYPTMTWDTKSRQTVRSWSL